MLYNKTDQICFNVEEMIYQTEVFQAFQAQWNVDITYKRSGATFLNLFLPTKETFKFQSPNVKT